MVCRQNKNKHKLQFRKNHLVCKISLFKTILKNCSTLLIEPLNSTGRLRDKDTHQIIVSKCGKYCTISNNKRKKSVRSCFKRKKVDNYA